MLKLFLLLFSCSIKCAEMTYDVYAYEFKTVEVNPKFYTNYSVQERAPSKQETKQGTTAAVSLNITSLYPYDNNITVKVETSQLGRDQARKSILNFEETWCTWVEREKVVWPIVMKLSNLPFGCPVTTKQIRVKDLPLGRVFQMTFAPFEKAVLTLKFLQTESREVMLEFRVLLRTQQREALKKRRH